MVAMASCLEARCRPRCRLLRLRDVRTVELVDSALADELGADAELAVVKGEHRREFQDAVIEALHGLPARERNLLRLHLCAGVSTHKLATMFRVDQSTVARWLAAARERVRAATFERLRARLGLSARELDSLAGLLLSGLDVSLATHLKSDPG